MRGRRPDPLVLKTGDEQQLRELLRTGDTPLRVARRARILLDRSQQARASAVGEAVAQDRATVWRVCTRYRAGGLAAALYDAPRSGRPAVFSPQRPSRDRIAGQRAAGGRRS